MRHTGTTRQNWEPAREKELRAAEERLGMALPPSLREFLACSNSWENRDAPDGLLAAGELRWANDPRHDLVDAWSSFEEVVVVIESCLVVLENEDGRYVLLDPTRVGEDGEWLAYDWKAGDGEDPRPYPGFSALVTALAREEAHHPAGSGRPSS